MGDLNIMVLKKLDKKTKILLVLGFILFVITTLYTSSQLMDKVTKYELNQCIQSKQDLYDYCKSELDRCKHPFNNQPIIDGDFKNVFPE